MRKEPWCEVGYILPLGANIDSLDPSEPRKSMAARFTLPWSNPTRIRCHLDTFMSHEPIVKWIASVRKNPRRVPPSHYIGMQILQAIEADPIAFMPSITEAELATLIGRPVSQIQPAIRGLRILGLWQYGADGTITPNKPWGAHCKPRMEPSAHRRLIRSIAAEGASPRDAERLAHEVAKRWPVAKKAKA